LSVSGFPGFEVSGKLETNENLWKPENFFAQLLMTSSALYTSTEGFTNCGKIKLQKKCQHDQRLHSWIPPLLSNL
jgi:hypothetical protein